MKIYTDDDLIWEGEAEHFQWDSRKQEVLVYNPESPLPEPFDKYTRIVPKVNMPTTTFVANIDAVDSVQF